MDTMETVAERNSHRGMVREIWIQTVRHSSSALERNFCIFQF